MLVRSTCLCTGVGPNIVYPYKAVHMALAMLWNVSLHHVSRRHSISFDHINSLHMKILNMINHALRRNDE
jgi:hypothetical protein